MFFFFPLLAQTQPQSPAPSRPLLAAPRHRYQSGDATRSTFGLANEDLAGLGVDLVRRALLSFTSSLTALGNHSNALFAQVAAALAIDRAARATVSSMGSAGFRPSNPWQTMGQAAWFGPSQHPMSHSPFAAWAMMPSWAGNPWAPFAQALDVWTKVWTPFKPWPTANNDRHRSDTPPFTTVISMPGISWGFAMRRG